MGDAAKRGQHGGIGEGEEEDSGRNNCFGFSWNIRVGGQLGPPRIRRRDGMLRMMMCACVNGGGGSQDTAGPPAIWTKVTRDGHFLASTEWFRTEWDSLLLSGKFDAPTDGHRFDGGKVLLACIASRRMARGGTGAVARQRKQGRNQGKAGQAHEVDKSTCGIQSHLQPKLFHLPKGSVTYRLIFSP